MSVLYHTGIMIVIISKKIKTTVCTLSFFILILNVDLKSKSGHHKQKTVFII